MNEDPIDDWFDWRFAHSMGDDLTGAIVIVFATALTFVIGPLLF